MVDRLVAPEDRLVACWDGSTGGTANCVGYALRTIGESRIVRIDPTELRKQI
jgi:hypothetical protein